MKDPVIIVGDGWAATAAVSWLAHAGVPVRWVSGSGARLLAPLPFFAASPGVQIWSAVAARLGIDTGHSQKGCFLREYRGKGFREPAWSHAPTPGDRDDVFRESLWTAERRMTGVFEEKFASFSLFELEELIRTKTLSFKNVTRVEGAQVVSLTWENDSGRVKLASGEEFEFEKLLYADQWSALSDIAGIPKSLLGPVSKVRVQDFTKKFKPQSALQLVFHHDPLVGVGLGEGFLLELNREAGEETQRHAWGGFYPDGKKSLWTVVLTPEEVEDHHEVAKKIRRIKQALNRVFSTPEWIGEKRDFSATVTSETVRLEAGAIFADESEMGSGPIEAPLVWEKAGISFLTDAFGPAAALEQVGLILGLEGQLSGAHEVGAQS